MSAPDQLAAIADRPVIADLLVHYGHCLDTRRIELLETEVFDRDADVDFGFTGMYEDRHVRTSDGWRIAWRRFRRLGVSSVGVGEVPDWMGLDRERG